MSKRKPTIPPAKPARARATHREITEQQLIEKCVLAGSMLASVGAAFNMDPDGNSKHAAKLAAEILRRRRELVGAITVRPARTVPSLEAKARLALAVVVNEIDSTIGEAVVFDTLEAHFLQTFAEDVRKMMQALVQAPGSIIGVGGTTE